MHVAVVTHSPWLGGAERCVLEAVVALVDRGAQVTVLAPGEGDGTAALRETGVDVRLAPARWWAASGEGAPPVVDRAGAARTAAVLAEVAPDVVLSSTIVHPAGALAARQLGLPHAWWIHELGDLDHGFEFALGARQTRRVVGELSHLVLTSSRTVAAHLALDVPRARLREVPYWVDVPAADAPAIGFLGATARLAVLGRVRHSKGQQDAVRAVARLVAEGRDVVLDVVGAGFAEDVEALRDLACRLGVGPRVRLRGPRDPLAALDGADVVLVPSHLEAFGRVTVEAHKRGRPVVGAASGGTGELLVDGVTGLTHAPGDDAALAAAVARLLDDDVLRSRVARAGQDAACARFTADALATALLDALDETVQRAGARRQAAAA